MRAFSDAEKKAVWCLSSSVLMLLLFEGVSVGQPPSEESLKLEDPAEVISLIGDDLSHWRQDSGEWEIVGNVFLSPEDPKRFRTTPGDGVAVNGKTGRTVNLFSKLEHGDVYLHVEWMVPENSNSGVYLQGRYEIQILDSWGVEDPHYSDAGGIYQRWRTTPEGKGMGFEGYPPRENAALPPGEWQVFDIWFRAPRFNAEGEKIENAEFLRVLHNGVLVHDHVEVTGPTRAAAFRDEKPFGPLMLQGDHGPVAYRNVTIRPLRPGEGEAIEEPAVRVFKGETKEATR
jgi:hypothetical protein